VAADVAFEQRRVTFLVPPPAVKHPVPIMPLERNAVTFGTIG